jgi:mRNA interferase RelE/StbE
VAYTVLLTPAAEREWRKLPRDIRRRARRALLALEGEPRPHGTTKLTGGSDRWRIRVGDYRVIYHIDDAAQEVTVLRIAHRRQVYR